MRSAPCRAPQATAASGGLHLYVRIGSPPPDPWTSGPPDPGPSDLQTSGPPDLRKLASGPYRPSGAPKPRIAVLHFATLRCVTQDIYVFHSSAMTFAAPTWGVWGGGVGGRYAMVGGQGSRVRGQGAAVIGRIKVRGLWGQGLGINRLGSGIRVRGSE
jgi:hypothetical protein